MLRCMRTTLTLDDDVAALLERFRRERKVTLKGAVNMAIRRGLTAEDRVASSEPFRTRVWDSGPPLIPQLDDVAEVLAAGEGDRFG